MDALFQSRVGQAAWLDYLSWWLDQKSWLTWSRLDLIKILPCELTWGLTWPNCLPCDNLRLVLKNCWPCDLTWPNFWPCDLTWPNCSPSDLTWGLTWPKFWHSDSIWDLIWQFSETLTLFESWPSQQLQADLSSAQQGKYCYTIHCKVNFWCIVWYNLKYIQV